MQKGYEEKDLKEYMLEDVFPNCGFRILALPNTCYFCEYCTDIWWDYSNGPYMFYCEMEHDENGEIVNEELVAKKGLYGKCELFKGVNGGKIDG